MAGLDPAIHVDPRDKPGDDELAAGLKHSLATYTRRDVAGDLDHFFIDVLEEVISEWHHRARQLPKAFRSNTQ